MQLFEQIYNSPAAHGAEHHPWGGFTDRNVCNIHRDEHLASCDAAIRTYLSAKNGASRSKGLNATDVH